MVALWGHRDNASSFLEGPTKVIARSYPPDDNDPYLHPKEVAARISRGFPNSNVDWDLAYQRWSETFDKLKKMGAPPPIMEGHLNLFGNSAYIEVRSPESGEMAIGFWAHLDTTLELEAIRPARNNHEATQLAELAHRIANCLEYEIEMID